MTTAEEGETPPKKRRKVDPESVESEKGNHEAPFYPFRLVPSPQEKRTLETSKSPLKFILTNSSGSMDYVNSSDSWSLRFAKVRLSILLLIRRFIQERLTPLDIAKDNDLTHVKRVRRAGQKTEDGLDVIDIILCAKSTIIKEELDEIVKEAAERGVEISPRLQIVSRWAAYTTKQLDEFKVLWPVTLRKDTTRSIKSPAKEAREMKKYMLETINLSKERKSAHPEDLPITALLVDPKSSKVLLTAHDTRISTSHPLNHAIMNILNELPSLLPASIPPEEEEQYYASMYDMYITHEPCTMCCMALVHSRIRRLIFWRGMKMGAREIGWMKGDEVDGLLNHRFMSFEGIPGALGDGVDVEEITEDICA